MCIVRPQHSSLLLARGASEDQASPLPQREAVWPLRKSPHLELCLSGPRTLLVSSVGEEGRALVSWCPRSQQQARWWHVRFALSRARLAMGTALLHEGGGRGVPWRYPREHCVPRALVSTPAAIESRASSPHGRLKTLLPPCQDLLHSPPRAALPGRVCHTSTLVFARILSGEWAGTCALAPKRLALG